MISVTVTIPADVIEAINEQIGRTPALMNRAYMRATSRLKSRMLQELQAEPGPVVYANNGRLRWKSDKQRRYVMMLLRAQDNLPYERTGQMSAAWEVNIDSADDGGSIMVENDNPAVQFVQGDWAQPFHLDTGWPQAAPIIAKYSEEAEDVLIETWFTVTDIYAGVPA